MEREKKELLRRSVRDTYGTIAKTGGNRCCGGKEPELVAIQLGYSKDDLAEGAGDANLGLGCGNPIASGSLQRGETVLDLGSGAGFDCFIAARAVGSEGKVIGVDMTPEMIERAEKNAGTMNVSNVEFRLGEIERLPVADNSVDIIISNCVINLSTDKSAAYREAFRVLKPGGRIAISDIVLRRELPEEMKDDLDLYTGCIGGALPVRELRSILDDAGFENISITEKGNSSAITGNWESGQSVDEYIVSANITATKGGTISSHHSEPGNAGSKPYFESVASEWDTMRKVFFPEEVREVAYAAAQLEPGKIAADLGAGTGFMTEGLLQRGIKVIAVDQSPAMLAHMKKKFGRSDMIEYRTGDAGNLPLEDRSVDYVFANMYLHHVESPREAVREMARVLKPGGRCVITDLDTHTFEFLRTEQHDRWMGFERSDILRWFEEAGLQSVAVDCVGKNCCASSSTTDDEARVSIFVATGVRRKIFSSR
jgi:arsenite methyltransferase